jgi:hypothetical protein
MSRPCIPWPRNPADRTSLPGLTPDVGCPSKRARPTDAVARLAGVDRVLVMDETLPGESRSTFAVAAGGDELVVKLIPGAQRAIDNSGDWSAQSAACAGGGATPRPSTSAWGNQAAPSSQSSDACQAGPCTGDPACRPDPSCSPRCSPASLLPSSCGATQAEDALTCTVVFAEPSTSAVSGGACLDWCFATLDR